MSEFLSRLLSPEGMAAGRAAVVSAYEWFGHASLLEHFDRIKAEGLHPRNPGGHEGAELVAAALGPEGSNIVCLSPLPKKMIIQLGKNAPMFKMVIHRDALPGRVGIDSSFGGTFARAEMMRSGNPEWSDADAFLSMVRNREVIVSFDAILPSALRVCPKAAPASPFGEWPMLSNTDLAEVEILKPDLLGNVGV